MAAPDKQALFEWLDHTIDDLPATGQIILNFDGNTVKWEVKANYQGHDRNGDIERTEVRRFGELRIKGREHRLRAALIAAR